MTWTAVASVALALLAVVLAFGVVLASRSAARRLRAARPLPDPPPWLRDRAVQSGLVLAAGAAVALALTLVFMEIVDSVTEQDDLTAIDRPVLEWIAAHRSDWLNTLVIRLTDIGGRFGLTFALGLTAIVVAVRLRSWRPLVLAAVAGLGGALLVTGIKAVVARDRPDPVLRAIAEDGFSFPSGHAANSLVILCTVAWLVSMAVENRTVRATVWVAAVPLALAIGLSRIYLAVHYPTDVLAGWVLAATWLTAVALAVRLPGSPVVPLLRRR